MRIPEWTWEFDNYLIIVGGIAVVIQLFFLLFFHLKVATDNGKIVHERSKLPPITVIICARNEAENLSKNLIHILRQKYFEFEVIVVNDRSWDDSDIILDAFTKTYKNLRWINIDKKAKVASGKKFALTIGIKGAKYDHVLLTDADCLPTGENWIMSMALGFTETPSMVLGYSPYQRMKGFLNGMIRFDTTFIGLQYLSFAKAGLPYMGVGRNMGYHKDLFFSTSGFKSHYSIPSGDDDLFVQEAANAKNIKVVYHKDSVMKTIPKTTWKDWITQKSRHLTTASKYKVIHKLLLGIYPISMYLMLVSFAFLLFSIDWWVISCGVFALVSLTKWVIWGIVFNRLQSKELILWLPIFELINLLIIPLIFLSSNEQQKKEWL